MSITIFSFIILLFFFFVVIESVRRGGLETRDSILWIILCLVLGVLSLSDSLLEWIAHHLGVHYAPSLLFLFGLLGTMVLIFDLTRRISRQNQKLTNIIQEYAIFKEETTEELEKLQAQLAELKKREVEK